MVNVSFEPLSDGPGVAAVDPIQRHRYAITTGSGADPEPVDPDRLLFPVDVAIGLSTDWIELPDVPSVFVRDGEGSMLAQTEPPTDRTFPPGEYYLEICTPIKLYLKVSGSVTVDASLEGKRFAFGEGATVLLGARSKHDRPAGTVTTTAEPADLMAAISTFGSALKTTSPERSFPTLRGHPPTVELGDRVAVPDGIEPPDTGVEIEVPPDRRHAYVASPLSYYLGASVVPGPEPRLVTDEGYVHPLGPDFERAVERVLKGTFLLDCVTRTEGLYDVPLAERRRVGEAVDLDFAALYDQPLAERLSSYLAVPYGALEPHVPEWKLTTHVATTPATVETLPFVVADLAVVRTGSGTGPAADPTPARPDEAEAVDSFFREGSFTRGPRSAAASGDAPGPTVAPESAGSMEQAWVGDGVPFGASKATAAGYHNRIDRAPTDGDIDVTVVCNDAKMLEEYREVDDIYGSREELAFDVTAHESLTAAELRDVLAEETAFFHYIGHIDDDGFECADGSLDAATVGETGVESFLLNACRSYDQGIELVEAGAVGGIVTLEDVVNAGAVDVGYTFARLLNNGYPLSASMEIAREGHYTGHQYIAVGDGSFAFVQGESLNPSICKIAKTGEEYELSLEVYLSSIGGIGAISNPYLDKVDEYYLSSGEIGPFSVTKSELREFLQLEDCPVKFQDKLYWREELDLDSL